MDITSLYLQKEIRTGTIICFTNNSDTIYIEIYAYIVQIRFLMKEIKLHPAMNVLSFSNIKR